MVLEGEADAYLESEGLAAIVIRPDRYILGSARSATDLDAVTRAIPLAETGRCRD